MTNAIPPESPCIRVRSPSDIRTVRQLGDLLHPLNVTRACGLVGLCDSAPKEGMRFQKETPRFVALNMCDVWFAGIKRNKLQPKYVNGKLVKFCVKVNITGNKAHEIPFISVYVTSENIS